MFLISPFVSCFYPKTNYEEKALKSHNKSIEAFEKSRLKEESFWLKAQEEDLRAFRAKKAQQK